jgi:hypothetical protein
MLSTPPADDPTELRPVAEAATLRVLDAPPVLRSLGRAAHQRAVVALAQHQATLTPALLAMLCAYLDALDRMLRAAVATGDAAVVGRVDRVVLEALDGLETARLALLQAPTPPAA